MTKTGSGTLILSGNNSYSGGTTIAAGTLQLGNDGASGSIVGNVADNGTLAFDRSDVSTFAGAISGTGALVQLGSGTTALTADNSYTGGTTISAGTLQLGDGGTSGSIVGNVTNNGTLAFDRADTFTFGGAISGMGAVNQIGPGTTVLTADNSYSGPTNVEVGTLAAGAPDVFSPNSVHGIAPGATLDLAGFDQTVAGVNNAGTIEMHGAGPGTTLTVDGNYVGNNGTIGLNTFLGTDGSPSDRLVLNGRHRNRLHRAAHQQCGRTRRRDPGRRHRGRLGDQRRHDGAGRLLPRRPGGARRHLRLPAFPGGSPRRRPAELVPAFGFHHSAFSASAGIPSRTGAGITLPPGLPETSLPEDPPPSVLPPGTYPIIGPEIATYSVPSVVRPPPAATPSAQAPGRRR